MTSWSDFASAEPDFARRVQALLQSQKHMTLATLRRDGSPRISGTEADIVDGQLTLGMMPRSLKALDLRADPRLALHSPALDPPADDTGSWGGDAKVSGRAVEIVDSEPGDSSHRFRVDIDEVVLTKVGSPADHLVIESWHPNRGKTIVQRR